MMISDVEEAAAADYLREAVEVYGVAREAAAELDRERAYRGADPVSAAVAQARHAEITARFAQAAAAAEIAAALGAGAGAAVYVYNGGPYPGHREIGTQTARLAAVHAAVGRSTRRD